MKCPNCRLENPNNAIRCDCGYDFSSGGMKGSLLAASREQVPNTHRIAGWLWGPALGLLLTLGAEMSRLTNLFGRSDATLELVIRGAWIGFALLVAWAFFRRHRRAPLLVIALIVVNIGFGVVPIVITGEMEGRGIITDHPDHVAMLLRSLLFAGIWIPYFLSSRRVKLTFVR
jgi:hypothetical protein